MIASSLISSRVAKPAVAIASRGSSRSTEELVPRWPADDERSLRTGRR
jgi:hypothetical protein